MNYARKSFLLITLILLGIFLAAYDHRGIQIGEQLFRAIGIEPRIRINSGTLYISNIISNIMIILPGIFLVRHLRLKYTHVGKKVIVSTIILLLAFPTLSYWFMLATHFNKTGLSALDFSQNDSNCSYQSGEGVITYNCQLAIINYGGKYEDVIVKPLLDVSSERFAEIEIEPYMIGLPPRTQMTYHLTFSSVPTEMEGRGRSDRMGIAFIKDGEERVILRDFT